MRSSIYSGVTCLTSLVIAVNVNEACYTSFNDFVVTVSSITFLITGLLCTASIVREVKEIKE